MKVLTAGFLKTLLLGRDNDTHKGSYGHLLIIAGCQSMPGAAVLATAAALQSGCGLVTLHSTARALDSAAVNCPSAILSCNPGNCFTTLPADLSKYNAICIGPGLGKADETLNAFSRILTYSKSAGIPLLIDADALNLLAENPDEMDMISEDSVLTPHPGELRRLFSGAGITDDIEKLCEATHSTVVAKGYRTRIFTPQGDSYINPTGGPGLAKAGSGDVLAGLTAGLMARGYNGTHAALLGTWIHGTAGDVLTEQRTAESFSSLDLAGSLHQAFKILYSSSACSQVTHS